MGYGTVRCFVSVATGVEPSATQYAIYPLAIVCVVVVLLKNRKPNDETLRAYNV